jgi:mannose-6-phosphate isomerase-like protein (cupin superfamily)
LEIGFNPEFFREGLESAESEELILKLISPLRPGLIQSGDEGSGLIYLVMPIRLNFHHFHSTAHEVLGIVAGSAVVILGRPDGRRFDFGFGDVLVLPAGTGHCNAGSSGDLEVVGAYPGGMRWDLRRGDPAEREEVLRNIRAVPLPDADPVQGPRGPLTETWQGGA